MKIVYLILHYLAGDDTIECIGSILNATKDSEHETKIVIVDNGSPNDSFEKIKNVFGKNEKVILLHSDENLGFAKGNNLGFRFAKNELNADFIVQLNNDTILEQKTFNEVLVKKFQEKQYSVLGPDIIAADGYHQNPGYKQSWSLKELTLYRIKKRIRIFLSYLHLDSLTQKTIEKVKVVYSKDAIKGDVENTILHGACLIYSPLFISRFDGMCDKTFLYWEEDILKLQADFYGFLMLYSANLELKHKEDAATNMVAGSSAAKIRRKYRFLIKSSKVYSRLKKEMLKQQRS